MDYLEEISKSVKLGKYKTIAALTSEALDNGIPADEILSVALMGAMEDIGEKFAQNKVFIPQVMAAAKTMNTSVDILKPWLAGSDISAKGRICIGTVKGDHHNIGKNLVKIMLEGSGFEVIDLGTNVSAETFINTAKEKDCDIIALSALLTTTMGVMDETVKLAKSENIRAKIMIGGAPVTEDYRIKIGADGYAPDAASAVTLAASLMNK